METIKHQCIKCQTIYSDTEIDAYYCPDCLVEKKKIAKEIDKKLAGNVTQHTKSDFQLYEEQRLANGGKFPHFKSLGL